MLSELEVGSVTITALEQQLGEREMVQHERWEEMRRLRLMEGVSISEIARRFDLDRKTVRRCLRESEWRRYQRSVKAETLLAEHASYLRERVAQVNYSARNSVPGASRAAWFCREL